MSEATSILEAAAHGDPLAAEQLLPLVYDELRKLAAAKLAHEKPGQTLQATALVHEAYLRLIGGGVDRGQETGNRKESSGSQPLSSVSCPLSPVSFHSRGHFFAAAAEAMRRLLIEQARRKGRSKREGNRQRIDLDQLELSAIAPTDEMLAIDEALTKLEAEDPQAAQLVKLRFFAGMSLTEAAEAIGISRTSAYEQWSYARAWLRCSLEGDASASSD
jgi:RNA polymerase sigma factor (sigma-70 family)